MIEHVTRSEEETEAFARQLGAKALAGELYAVHGDLGAGKTLMAKAFAEGLGISEEITSPTFTILEVYPGLTPFYHFDLYRIASHDELDMLGFDEYFYGNGVSWVEWPERAEESLPDDRINLYITILDDTTRRITVEYSSDRNCK